MCKPSLLFPGNLKTLSSEMSVNGRVAMLFSTHARSRAYLVMGVQRDTGPDRMCTSAHKEIT